MRLSRERRRDGPGQGAYVAALPHDFPPDAYLDTFETNAMAAMALFWANSGYATFNDFRDVDVSATSPEAHLQHALLEDAIVEQCEVPDADLERAMRRFYYRASPGTAAVTCASCCATDVPFADRGWFADGDLEGLSSLGVLEFVGFECRPDDPLLAPLRYTAAEDAAYDAPVPQPHVVDTVANRTLWRRYCRVVNLSLWKRVGWAAALRASPPKCPLVGVT